jgi:pimeloyl-ACP methyl ester carboxylesterase
VLAQLVAEKLQVAGVIDIDGNLSRGDCTFSAQAIAYTREDFAAGGFDVLRDEAYKRGIADPALRGYYAAMRMADPHVFHRHATELVALSESEVLVGRLAALRVPVLYIAGVPGGACERSRALLGNHGVRWVGIEPAGHWPFIDQPDAFAAAVRSL